MSTRRILLLALAAAGPAPLAGAVEPVTLTTGDGARVAARFYPSAKPGAKSPAVMVLDDLGDDARPALCDDLARQFAGDGYAVLCFDFRGHGKSRAVEPEFWEFPTNKALVRGYRADAPPEEVRFADFRPGYLPTLVNDVAAARAHLERRNDARECNTAQMYVIGFGRGATLGQMWVASECSRYRVSGLRSKLAMRSEGRDVAGCVWVGPGLALDGRPVPILDLILQSDVKRSTLVGLIHDPDDADLERFSRQCQDALNAKNRGTRVAVRAVAGDGASLATRAEVAERVGRFVTDMRKVQEQPLWDDRDFRDRRYVWAFRGAPWIDAKDEGEYHFFPVPVDYLLGKR